MQAPISPWLGLSVLAAVFLVLAWRLWRLRQLVRSGRKQLQPLASMGTLRTYGGAILGTTAGLAIWHVLFDRHPPRFNELYSYLTMLAVVSPLGRRWLDRFRAWLTRP